MLLNEVETCNFECFEHKLNDQNKKRQYNVFHNQKSLITVESFMNID